jgi:hypothetical protein
LDLQNDSFSQTTAMLYIDPNGDGSWENHGKFTSDNIGHAEDHILTYLLNEVYYMGDAHVLIEITKSPCGSSDNNCAQHLIDFKKEEAKGRGIKNISIKALGFYKASEETKHEATNIHSTKGMSFEIWDVMGEMKSGGPPEGYDNEDTLRAFANAHLYQQEKSGRKTDALTKSQFNQESYAKFMGFQ